MKILYITAEGFDTPNPNNQMAEVMIRDFLKSGHSVHLVQSHRKGLYPDIPKSLENLPNFTFDTVKRKVVDKSDFVKRYLNDVKYAFSAKKYWKKVKDADVIYLQSGPTVIYPMRMLHLFKRKLPIVYSVYDVFPGHAYEIGVIKSKFVYNILRVIQKPCYRIPQAITVLSDDMKKKVVEQGADPGKVHVVPAWYDVSTAGEVPAEKNRFLKKYGIEGNKFTVQYAGSIGYVFDYKAVIELAKRLKEDTDINIRIVGDGPLKDIFVAEAESECLTNISFYPLQPVELTSDVYSACDISIIPLRKGVIGNGVPSKAPILMNCKRVIVNSVDINSDYAKMFEEHNMGVAVDTSDSDGLAQAVIELKNSPEKRRIMAENAYAYGKEIYSSDASTEKIIDIFWQVSGKRKIN